MVLVDLLMFSVFRLWVIGALSWCVWDVSASLSSSKSMVFDFSFSNNDTGEDCTAELSSELFSHARITLTSEGPGKFNDTLFFVRISSYRQGSTDETCTQYSSSGGDGRTYHHDEDCLPSEDVQTTSLSSSSAVGDMTTILLRAPNSYWQDLTWRVCVGHKGAHHHARTMAHDDDMDASSVDFTLFAAGRVELLTSPSDNMSSRISTQSPELVLTRRLNDVVVGENHRIQLKYDVSSSSASKGGGFPAFVHSQATAPAACADASSYANGYCDSANNLAACNYDGGDCCFEDCANSTTCFQDLSSYPKACHKDETISVISFKTSYSIPVCLAPLTMPMQPQEEQAVAFAPRCASVMSMWSVSKGDASLSCPLARRR